MAEVQDGGVARQVPCSCPLSYVPVELRVVTGEIGHSVHVICDKVGCE